MEVSIKALRVHKGCPTGYFLLKNREGAITNIKIIYFIFQSVTKYFKSLPISYSNETEKPISQIALLLNNHDSADSY